MRSLKTYTVLFLMNLALAALSASASSALVTQYIAPVNNPTWEKRVVTGDYGTGKGIEFSRELYSGVVSYCNYSIKIGDAFFGIFYEWCQVSLRGTDPVFPNTIVRSVLTPNAESKRFLYPLENPDYSARRDDTSFLIDLDDEIIVQYGLDTNEDGAEYVQCVHTDWVYTVTFRSNDGADIKTTQTYTNSATLVANSFTRTGYTFDGWDSGTRTYQDKATVSGSDLILDAQWEPIKYAVTSTSAGNGNVSPSGTHNYNYGSVVTNTASPSAGYHFVHWKYTDGSEISTDNTYIFEVTGEVSITAVFAPNTYTLKYDKNGGEGPDPDPKLVSYEGTIVLWSGENLERNGYTLSGWTLTPNGSTIYATSTEKYVRNLVGNPLLGDGGDLTLYAVWQPKSFWVTFDDKPYNSWIFYNQKYYGLTNALPTKTGYAFEGYYLGQDNGVCYFDAGGIPQLEWNIAEATTLYAHWTPIEYYVVFAKNADDASGSMGTMALTYDVPTNLTGNAFSRNKWLFDGWTNTEAQVRYEDGAVVSNLTSQAGTTVTLHALWRRDTFDLELHNGEDTAYLSVTNGFEYGLLPIPKNSGSAEFAGWWTTNDLDVAKQVSGSDCADKSQTPALYARWKPVEDHKTCTVTFLAAGGTPESQTKELTVGREFGELPTVSYGAGYALLGWYLEGKRVTPETIVPGNVTLVARKTLKEFNDAWGCDDIAFETDSGWSIDSSTKVAQSATAGKENDDVELSLEFLTDEDGTLSFDWFAACRPPQSEEFFAYLQFYGGEYNLGIAASTEYATKSDLSIQGGKKYLFKYGRDVKWIPQDGDDCGRVKDFAWKPRSKALGIDEWVSFVSITSSFENATFAVGGNAQWRTLDDTSVVAVTNLEDSGVAWLELSLSGPGELQFDWRVSSEPGFVDTNGVEQICDYLEFLFDGGRVSEVHGLDMFDYTSVVFTNESPGVHKYRWRYAKDDSAKAGEDSAYLKNLSWTPFTTEVEYDDPHGGDKKVVLSVPNSWVDKYNLLSEAKATSYGEALMANSGKKGPGGADLPYWYDYVAGTDPTNSASLFKIKSVSVVDDTVNIEWDPDWSDPSGDIYREYTIWGKTNLTDEVWHTPTNSASRFFKVEVSLSE